MRLIDADALGQKVFSHNYSVPILGTENTVLSEVLQMIHNAPTIARAERPFVMLDGMYVIYITQGHIDAMIEYERKEHIKEVVERLTKSLKEATTGETPGANK